MASPLDFLTGKAKGKPREDAAPQQEASRITRSTCVQFDKSAADFGASAGSGQDSELSAFEQVITANHRQINKFNERLADEQTKQSQGAST